MHFLTNHPELIDDITETLKLRQHDSEESVRYEVVIAIVSTAKKDFDVVSQSEDLLNFVKVCRRKCYGSGMFIPDPGSKFFPSRIPDPHQRM
jgi:hypothetical protein